MIRPTRTMFLAGDCGAGALTGALTAFAVRAVVAPGSDMVVGMMLGTAVGMVLHVVIGLVLSPLLGMFETMLPGMYIGMHGGMLFGMRDAMQGNAVTPAAAVWIGAVFGVLIVLIVHFWNQEMRRSSAESAR